MKKYRKIAVIISLFMLVYVSFIIANSNKSLETEEIKNTVKISKGISMNLEQTAGAGDYKTVTQSSWPTEGYIFNSELSKCENGSTLSWNNTKKVVIVSGNLSDKCYVYFDITPTISDICSSSETLTDCIIKYGNQGSDISNIYVHDSSLTNGAGDNSYRYSGANPNNFVCFGTDATPCPTDNLYRIIGVFNENYHGVSGKQLVKLIKYDYATNTLLGTDGDYASSGAPEASYYRGNLTTIDGYYWNYKNDTTINNGNGSNTWSTSLLNKINLNTNFINNIGTTWADKIATTTWKVGGNIEMYIRNKISSSAYKYEIINPVTTNTTDNATEYDAKIGLMYASDYGFAADPSAWTTKLIYYYENINETTIKSQNWMYMGYHEWIITRTPPYPTSVYFVQSRGDVSYNTVTATIIGVRPVFNLEQSVPYVSGTGTQSDPIIIN